MDVLASWKIENVAEQNKREEMEKAERNRIHELSIIERFEEVYGCPLDVFVKTLTEPDPKKATSSPRSKATRASRILKNAGYGKMTPGIVEKCRDLLERHRPDLMPPSAPEPSPSAAVQSAATVVPFRKPNGNDKPDGNGPTAA
jgi:hypothetical protein